MAGTGYDWSAWSYVQLSAGDWDGDSSADDAIQTSDAIALDGKAACIIGIVLDEPDDDAVPAYGAGGTTNYTAIATAGAYAVGGLTLGNMTTVFVEAGGTLTFDSATNPTWA